MTYLAAQPAIDERRHHAHSKRPFNYPRDLPFQCLVLVRHAHPITHHLNLKLLPRMFSLSPLLHLRNFGRMPNSIVVLKHALRDHPDLLAAES